MRRVAGAVAAVLAAAGGLVTATRAAAAPAEEPLTPVVHDVLAGDLVMAGNSNLVSAGGWRPFGDAVADVDGDDSQLCIGRRYVPAACGENSSSATLDIPAGSRVVAARLYVNTSLSAAVSPIRVRLDGPSEGYHYVELAADTPGIPKVRESAGTTGRSVPMRQAVWDLTEFVRSAGAGSYTVADIMFERAAAFLPYASWTIVAAYELDPATDVTTLTPEQEARFAERAITWDDGFQIVADGAVEVTADGFDVPGRTPTFGKTFHLVAHAQHRGADSLLFAGRPLGNNAVPGEAAPPFGVVVGTDPACNSITDVLNDSICNLGTPVAAKTPGPSEFFASTDGTSATSGSGVDFDVLRVPSRYFLPGATSASLSLQVSGSRPVAVGMLAVSVDLATADPETTPASAP